MLNLYMSRCEVEAFFQLPIAGINDNGSGKVCLGDKCTVQPIHTHRFDIASDKVSEVDALVDPVICQSLWVIQALAKRKIKEGKNSNEIVK